MRNRYSSRKCFPLLRLRVLGRGQKRREGVNRGSAVLLNSRQEGLKAQALRIHCASLWKFELWPLPELNSWSKRLLKHWGSSGRKHVPTGQPPHKPCAAQKSEREQLSHTHLSFFKFVCCSCRLQVVSSQSSLHFEQYLPVL